ncbi:MAG TPA: helix-hairpin-helix domain-containing protein [Rhizomicrobium sp.]|nr:helix-hairpin-helix domain-containing protein [Rhizomicrobium sp.]
MVLGCGLLLSLTHLPAAGQPKAETPQGATAKICSGCHALQIVTDTPKDYDVWHDTVQAMIDRGAQGTPEEFELVMQYLFENMTTVDINHADQEALATVLHTSTATANAIIARRGIRPFKNLNELEGAIPGLDHALLDSKRRMIFFQ